METFSARRQLQPDVTSWFVQSCACSCSPYCRRAPVGDVKLVCLALLHLATRILQIIVLKLSLFSLSHISSSISKLCYLNLHLYNVSKFHVTGSRSNLIQYGKQQTVSERNLHGQNCPTSQMKVSRQNVCTPIFLLCVFISLFSLEYRINKTYWKLLTIVGNTTY